MKIVEVKTPELAKKWVQCPIPLYKGDPNYIRPIDNDIEKVFDPKKNKSFRHGRATRFLLVDPKGAPIGRAAAFVNDRTATKNNDQPTGGMGFFECVDDQDAANMIFDACKKWNEEQGMEAMDGPVNFGERDGWWGLLAEGFYPPTYQMNYNPKYYIPLFENYGFKLYFKQHVLFRNLQDPVQPRFLEKYDKLMRQPGYSFTHIKKKQLVKFAEDFRTIYNEAWARHGGVQQMRKEQAMSIMKAMKPILCEELVWFGYHQDKPIAFFIMIPDMNQIFKNFGGKLGLWQKLVTKYKIMFRKIDQCYGVIFGVVPEHQGKGVDAGLIVAAGHKLHPQGHWRHMEMNWIGDFNPKMLNVARGIGGEDYKTYYTMRYLFDREKEFKRMPLMDGLG